MGSPGGLRKVCSVATLLITCFILEEGEWTSENQTFSVEVCYLYALKYLSNGVVLNCKVFLPKNKSETLKTTAAKLFSIFSRKKSLAKSNLFADLKDGTVKSKWKIKML